MLNARHIPAADDPIRELSAAELAALLAAERAEGVWHERQAADCRRGADEQDERAAAARVALARIREEGVDERDGAPAGDALERGRGEVHHHELTAARWRAEALLHAAQAAASNREVLRLAHYLDALHGRRESPAASSDRGEADGCGPQQYDRPPFDDFGEGGTTYAAT